jgi:hypothetical protein
MTYNPNFSWKRKTVTISVPTSSLPAGYQIKLVIPKETEMQSDFRDLRFEYYDNVNWYSLSHWLESINTTPNPGEATVWVKLKDIVTAPISIDIYMYYGNPYVTSASNGSNTFDLFDDFESYTVGSSPSGWTGTAVSGYSAVTDITVSSTYSLSGSKSLKEVASTQQSIFIKDGYTFTNGIIETSFRSADTSLTLRPGIVFRSQNGSNFYAARGEYISSAWSNTKRLAGVWSSIVADTSYTWTANVWHNLKVVANGTSLTVSVGNTTLSGTDSSFSSGEVGFYLGNQGTGYFDNFRIRKYVTTEPATPTIGSTVTTVSWNPQRKKITVNTGASATPAYYQVKITVPFAPEMNIDFSDLRFVTKANPPVSLDYWIESFTPGVTADVWVELTDAINASSSDYIYMHYGNKYLTSVSNVMNTFVRVIGSDTDQPVKGAWTLDGNALDTSGNSNNGTLYGGMEYTTGKFGQACLLDGINDYIHSSSTPSIDGGIQATYEAWIYPLSEPPDGSYSAILVAGDDTQPSWYSAQGRLLYYNIAGATGSKFYFDCGTDNANTYRSRYTINSYAPNQWYHIVVVFNSGIINFYINGVSDDGTAAGSGTSINTNANNTFSIGANVRTGQTSMTGFFNGKIDEVRMYNRVLTQSEITDLYSNYGYITLNYPGRELIRKYVTTDPSFSIGTTESMNSFSYRKTLTINNNSGSSLTDYQIPITVTYTANMQSNFNDIRFVDSTGNLLSYWIESKTDSSTANVWIKVNLPNYGTSPTGDNKVYMYYGNSSITSVSDVNTTFIRVIGSTTEQPINAAWTLNGNALDTSGNNNNGTLYGGVTYSTGKFGNAGLFDGTSGYISVPDSSTLRPTKWTISAWIYPTDTPGDMDRIVFKEQLGNGGPYSILRKSNSSCEVEIEYFTSNTWYWGYWTTSANTLPINQWSRIDWVYTGKTGSSTDTTVYINGNLVSTTFSQNSYATVILNYTTQPLLIGKDTGGRYFKGTIDEVRIYNRALTPVEITDLYNNYGYTTTNYPGRELVRKYTSSEPTYSTGAEEQSTGSLNISSTPTGAEIFIDTVDQLVITPRVITGLTPGSHNYELTLSGYVSHTDTFSITSGSTTTISVTMVTPAHITATNLTITPYPIPCISGNCTVTVDVVWTNTGGTSGTFTPKINVGTNPVVVYSGSLQTVGPSLTVSQQFVISGMTTGIYTICPDPN